MYGIFGRNSMYSYQLGKHFNKHGKDLRYKSKAKYNQATREFEEVYKYNPNSEIFEGKFKNTIGIGSTLTDIKKYIGEYYDPYEIIPTYDIKDCDGICFQLLDIDALTDDYIEYDYDAIEKLLPIEYISIFKGKP